MTAPFGIEFYTALDRFSNAQEIAPSVHSVDPPRPHPLFTSYIVRSSPSLGIVWIKGIGPMIENDGFGSATRSAVDRVYDQLIQRYGPTTKFDMLLDGSIWRESQYWMAGIENKERFYSYTWSRKSSGGLPDDIDSVYVGATAYSMQAGGVVLEYASARLKEAELEIDRGMADLL